MRKGWFHIPGVQTGDRTIEQQLMGLGPLMAEVRDRTVLDLGCAEGLIAGQLLGVGARDVFGVEIVEEHVHAARQVVGKKHGPAARFVHAEVSKFLEDSVDAPQFHIVLALAIFHKLRNPARAAFDAGMRAAELCVVRLPPANAPLVIDKRSNYVPHDIAAAMKEAGLELTQVTRGHLDEWVGYFRRVAA